MNNNIISINSIKAQIKLPSIQSLKIHELVTSSCLSDIGPFFRPDILAKTPEFQSAFSDNPRRIRTHRIDCRLTPAAERRRVQGLFHDIATQLKNAQPMSGFVGRLSQADSTVPMSGSNNLLRIIRSQVIRNKNREVMAHVGAS